MIAHTTSGLTTKRSLALPERADLAPEDNAVPRAKGSSSANDLLGTESGSLEPLAPIDLVNRILVSDPTILAVLAIDSNGSSLAMACKGELPELRRTSEELARQASQIAGITVGSASQYANLYGQMQVITFRFQNAKVLVVIAPELRMSFIVRTIASADVDYVFNSIRSLLRLE